MNVSHVSKHHVKGHAQPKVMLPDGYALVTKISQIEVKVAYRNLFFGIQTIKE